MNTPSPEIIHPVTRESLAQVSVATLSTCLFKRGFRNRVMPYIQPLRSGQRPMVGPAYTLRFIPAREDIDVMEGYSRDDHVHRRAIEECPAGHVLVIDTGGNQTAASAGDIMLARLMVRGGAGAVTDGGFRDTPDIARLDFPVYQRGPGPSSSPIRLHPVDLNVPIGCAGVAVYPGDIVVGDQEGVIVIPVALADEVAAEALEMTRYETFAAEEILKGRSLFGIYPPSPESRAEYEARGRKKP